MSNQKYLEYMYNYDIQVQILILIFKICQHLCMLAESGNKEPQHSILSVT